ncbi:unnamed protein product [Darwinula stevensoni]|uniref:AIG1-type G domain-containing protein n=1 Tax=Darwinula stevensoni TaxID=69355 RepID=A0A7R9FPY9_9CRUS|nr:unnamed protein product [Darwinula stevensoni]CAG0898526.1 unnamed protein product [Darwinula stevensoni]
MKHTCRSRDEFIHMLPRLNVMEDFHNRLAKVEVGERTPTRDTGKVLMLVGPTGSGKSTLIDSIANYAYGVKLEDDFRLKLIEDSDVSQSESQTKWITAYVLHKKEGFALPYTLTVIDTPGIGDTTGLKADEDLRHQIQKFFSQGGSLGVDQIDGVGFVVWASQARLTASQRYIFDSILAIFGKDVERNIYVFATFADDHKPAVLEALKRAGISCRNVFNFNNAAIFRRKNETDYELTELFWKFTTKSFEKLFNSFQEEPVSLTLTKAVLKQRAYLEEQLQGILPQLKISMATMEQLREKCAALKQNEAEEDSNKQLPFTSKDPRHQELFMESGRERETNQNCFYIDGGEEMNNCPEFKKSGKIDSEKQINVTGTLQELVMKFKREKVKVLMLTKKAHECLQELDKIALKPDLLNITDYIDILIVGEKNEAKPGFIQRIKYLQDTREKAQLLEVLKNDSDPYGKYLGEFEQEVDISLFDTDPIND